MANSVPYSKYNEWADYGFPYDVGVSLLRQLHVLPHLTKLCANRRTPQNERLLKNTLQKYLAKVPGVPPGVIASAAPAERGDPSSSADAPPAGPPAMTDRFGVGQARDDVNKGTPAFAGDVLTPSQTYRLQTMAQQQAASTMPTKPAEVVPIHSGPRLKAVPFENLPEVMKPARLRAQDQMAERERLHAALLPVPAAAQCIHFRDMLRILEQKDATGKPVPFTLKRFTWNRKNRTGGELLTLHQAVHLTEAALPNPRAYVERQASRAATGKDPSARHKPGLHWKNATRNLLMPDGAIDKAIIWLIVEINGQRVVMGQNPSAQGQGMDAGALCKRIVELSDAVDTYFDAERLWAEKGVLPFVPESLEQKLRGYTEDQQDRYEKNTLNPAIYRANRALRTAEGDPRTMWERKLNEALQGRAILTKLREERKAEGEQAVEKILAKSAAKKAVKNTRQKARRAQKK